MANLNNVDDSSRKFNSSLIDEDDLKKNVHLALRLSQSTSANLSALCDKFGLDRSNVVRYLIDSYDVASSPIYSTSEESPSQSLKEFYLVNIDHNLSLYFDELPSNEFLIKRGFYNLTKSLSDSSKKRYVNLSLSIVNPLSKESNISFSLNANYDPISRFLNVYILDKSSSQKNILSKKYKNISENRLKDSEFINRVIRSLSSKALLSDSDSDSLDLK